MRNDDPRWRPGNFEKNVDAINQLAQLAGSKGFTPARLALAWLLAQGDDIVPIPGTRSARRLEENVGSVEVDLTQADRGRIAAILPRRAFGARYPEEALWTWS